MKKKIPLTILEALQPVVDNNLELTRIVVDTDSMFHLGDLDENSDFYYKVMKQEVRSGKLNYLVEFKPSSKDNVNPHSVWLTLNGVLGSIRKWLDLLQAYSKICTIYDDPILKSNQERFEKQFEILDENADTSTFDLSQQIYLDQYLSNVKSKLRSLQEGRTEKEVKELEELAQEATEIQSELTKTTKRQIVKRLSKFWAMAQRTGLDVIKEIFVSVTAELANRLITSGRM